MKLLATLGLIALAVVPAASVGAVSDGDSAGSAGPETAAFAAYRSGTIDLRQGWGTAKACHTDGRTTQCYDSESEMDAALRPGVAGARGFTGGGPSMLAACSSSVRLYTGTSYTGTVLSITIRFTFLTLSTYGFNNVTSSYKIGACGSSFYDGDAGTGSVYPGTTAANVQYPSMVTGWNDRISSIYIY